MKFVGVFLGTIAVFLTAAAIALAAQPGAIFSSSPATPAGADIYKASKRDPIVNPGPAGTMSEHLHAFCGSNGVDSNSTYDSMVAGTTQFKEKGIKSGVWEGQLFYDGVPVKVGTSATATAKACLVYYREVAPNAQPFPHNLNMVLKPMTLWGTVINLGDEIIYKCGPGSTTDLAAPPVSCPSTNPLLVTGGRYPNCWDGVNLDTVQPDGLPAVNPVTGVAYPNDHLSHMKYPPCDAAHPVNLIRPEQFFRHCCWTGTHDISKISIGTPDPAVHGWEFLHMDYKPVFQDNSMTDFMNRCIIPNIACATDIDLVN